MDGELEVHPASIASAHTPTKRAATAELPAELCVQLPAELRRARPAERPADALGADWRDFSALTTAPRRYERASSAKIVRGPLRPASSEKNARTIV